MQAGEYAKFGFVDTPVQYCGDRTARALSYLFQHAYYAQLLVWPWTITSAASSTNPTPDT